MIQCLGEHTEPKPQKEENILTGCKCCTIHNSLNFLITNYCIQGYFRPVWNSPKQFCSIFPCIQYNMRTLIYQTKLSPVLVG